MDRKQMFMAMLKGIAVQGETLQEWLTNLGATNPQARNDIEEHLAQIINSAEMLADGWLLNEVDFE